MSDHRRCLLARAGTNSEGTISSAPWEDSTKGNHWKPQGDLRDPEEEDTHNSWTVKSRPYQSLNAHPVQVIGEAVCPDVNPSYRGRRRLQSRPAQEREARCLLSILSTGPKGDRGGSNVTILLLGGSKSQDGEKPGGEVWTARKAPLSGTPERSNPNRELVKRKPSSDGGRRIRKRVR